MKGTSVATAVLGCAAAAVAPAEAFVGAPGLSAALSRKLASKRRAATSAVRMMAIDPAAVHSMGDYVNVLGSAGLDQAWVSQVMHGEK